MKKSYSIDRDGLIQHMADVMATVQNEGRRGISYIAADKDTGIRVESDPRVAAALIKKGLRGRGIA